MHWIFDYSFLFFDFDGLLVNTEHLHYSAYQKVLCAYKISFPWDFPSFAAIAHQSADGLRKCITSHARDIIEKITWEKIYAEKQREYQKLIQKGSLALMDGAKEILHIVQKRAIPHAVVTNSTREQTVVIKNHLPILKTIPLWVTREDYVNAKPAPDGYLTAIQKLGNTQKKMLGFEDTLRGVRSLEKAGILPVLICPPSHPQLENIALDTLLYFPSFQSLLLSI